uniref:Uncharacterized protein n=1 Tax=Globisporangium ultimum (strain ATCC 200006 / CBS 805.95 / DAOM BR144) TaxID=431595 RepID=K3WWW9_GLOUD
MKDTLRTSSFQPMVDSTKPSAPPLQLHPLPPPPRETSSRVALAFCGFDAENGAFLLSAGSAGGPIGVKRSRPESYLRREFVDFQNWDRQLSRTQKAAQQPFERLPTRRLRKLMEFSWLKNDASSGWRVELQKNVVACEQWINMAFRLLPEDQAQVFLNNQLYQQCKAERADALADAQRAKDLQQYFTSQPLVDFTLETVAKWLSSVKTDLKWDDVVWLEPSCGDGRFVTSLLDGGAFSVIGVELDEALFKETVDAVQEYDERAVIWNEDFLASHRPSRLNAHRHTVVAIGNPPFGDRSPSDLSTDLIQRFFRHVAQEWGAQVIAFIVPARCARPAYTELTLATLSAANPGCKWQLVVAEPLDDYYFEFRNTKRIKQPSVLQIFAADLFARAAVAPPVSPPIPTPPKPN